MAKIYSKQIMRKAYEQLQKEFLHTGDITIQDFIDGWVQPIDHYNNNGMEHRSDAIQEVLSSPRKKTA